MTNRLLTIALLATVALASCSKSKSSSPSSSADPASTTAGEKGSSGNQNQPGVITAGEWNDLGNWSFWEAVATTENFKKMPDYWNFYNKHRISVNVIGTDLLPVMDATVELQRDGNTIFTTRSDNKGKAELWADIFQNNENIDFSKLSISVNKGATIAHNIKPFKGGVNDVTVAPAPVANKIEIAFVVDATGSMGDELEYLKTELLDVINRVKNNNPNASLATAAVFYRDKKDDYVTKVSGFANDISATLDFIKKQSAGGGGDFPEAVDVALDRAVNELQWSTGARTRIMFLVLDAPPHHESQVTTSVQNSISKAAEKGIKIIPITASGIDKETEFLMRSLSISTNGTYVFITDDSGVGNSHLKATVGQYDVELLNNLMVRLINKYAQ